MLSIFKNKIALLSALVTAIWTVQYVYIDSAFAVQCDQCHKEGASSVCSQCKRAIYCSKTCQEAHWKAHKRPCKQIRNGVEIREDSLLENAGRGLFATKAFAQGEKVAIYVGKTLKDSSNMNLDKLQFSIKAEASSYYQLVPGTGMMIDGEVNPENGYLGAQLANDPYIARESIDGLASISCLDLERGGTDRAKEDQDKIDKIAYNYLQQIMQAGERKANVQLVFDQATQLAFLEAIRNIRPGEEIYHQYGLGYWMGQAMQLCNRKGLPGAGLVIQKVASEVVEKSIRFVRGSQMGFADIFSSYVNSEQFHLISNLIKHPDKLLAFRLSSLFFEPFRFEIRIKDDAKWKELAGIVRLESKLDEISSLNNQEFYDRNHSIQVHQRSIDLMVELIDQAINSKNEGVFEIYHISTRRWGITNRKNYEMNVGETKFGLSEFREMIRGLRN